jgi:hypothetical protein
MPRTQTTTLTETSRTTLADQVRKDVISAAQSTCESRDWETLGISIEDWWPQTYLHHSQDLADKIQAYVLTARDGAKGCLELGRDENPHRVSWRGHRQKVYQLIAWALAGDIPRHGLVVRHKCDNHLCIHPLHLEVGTQSANLVDQRRTGARRQKWPGGR